MLMDDSIIKLRDQLQVYADNAWQGSRVVIKSENKTMFTLLFTGGFISPPAINAIEKLGKIDWIHTGMQPGSIELEITKHHP